MAGLPHDELTQGMGESQYADDNPANLPQEEKDTNYGRYENQKPTDATDDVLCAGWGMSETYRRLNARGK